MKIEEKALVTFDDIFERSNEIDTLRDNTNVRQIVAELKTTMKRKNLAALSAPAIGYNKRIFCINFEEEIKTFINPIIAKVSGISLSKEISELNPAQKYLVVRNNDIDIIYQRPQGQTESRKMLGMAAYLFQQQINLLDGITLADIGLAIDQDFEDASPEEQQAVINMFLDSLDIKSKDLNKEVEEDADLKQTSDAIKFMEGVANGTIKQDPSK